MTYILEQWQIDALRERKRITGRTIAGMIRDAIKQCEGKVAGKQHGKQMRKSCHLVRFSIDADFGMSSDALRGVLTAFLAQPVPQPDKARIAAEIASLDAEISAFFASYQNVPYILEKTEG